MKVLLVVHDYLPAHVGGTEVHAHRLARALQRLGCEVAVACTERDLGEPEGRVREREHEGVRVLEAVHQREYASVRETWTQPASARVFSELVSRERPEVVHFHHFAFWGAGCLAAARAAGAASFVTLHDYWLLCDNGFLLRPDGTLCRDGRADDPAGCDACLRRHPLGADAGGAAWSFAQAGRERRAFHARALAGAAPLIAPSRFLAGVFAASGLVRAGDLEVSAPAAHGPWREPRRSDPARPLALAYVGGLYPSKGVHVLIEALRRVPEGALTLDVHGALDWFPDYVQSLRAAAAGLPVRFRGRFAPADVDRVLAGADALVVPSLWYENMPLAILDAYRNGLAVVASDLGGLAEAVAHERSGLLFAPGDARALAAQLERLAGERELVERLARGRPRLEDSERQSAALFERYRASLRGGRER